MSDELNQQNEQLEQMLQEAEAFPTDVRQGVDADDLITWAARLEDAAQGAAATASSGGGNKGGTKPTKRRKMKDTGTLSRRACVPG